MISDNWNWNRNSSLDKGARLDDRPDQILLKSDPLLKLKFMVTTLNACNLDLEEVHRLLNFQMQPNGAFAPLLTLEPITDFEQQELSRIRDDFFPYVAGKLSEGIVKAMTMFPLLRLAGFYSPPIRLRIEEGIGEINIESEDTKITGRFDIVSVNRAEWTIADTPFWILAIEAKEGLASPWAGLPQLLTYSHKSLEQQSTVWGLVTTGLSYQFIYVRSGHPAIYELLPLLNLFEANHLPQLLQVLKAIRGSRLETQD